LANKAKRRDIQVMRGGVKSCRRGGYSRGRGRNQRGRGRSDFDRIEKLTDVSLLQTSQLSFALEKSLKLNPIDFTGSCKERGQRSIHLVFHVSLLKGKIGNNVVTASIMPLTDEGEGGRVKLFWK
jgi:hypothetical protein